VFGVIGNSLLSREGSERRRAMAPAYHMTARVGKLLTSGKRFSDVRPDPGHLTTANGPAKTRYLEALEPALTRPQRSGEHPQLLITRDAMRQLDASRVYHKRRFPYTLDDTAWEWRVSAVCCVL